MIELPQPLLRGSASSRCLAEFLRDDDDLEKYAGLFVADQPRLSKFFIPPFQRPAVWESTRQAKFVESAFLGINLGTIVWNNAERFPKTAEGTFHHTDQWLIDGQQRMRALLAYVADELVVFADKSSEHRYSQLSKSQKRHFMNVTIGTFEIQSNDEEELRRIYDLMNFGGVAHTEDQRASAA